LGFTSNKRCLLLSISLIVFITIICLSNILCVDNTKIQTKEENIKINEFFNVDFKDSVDNHKLLNDNTNNKYTAILEIPSINLRKGLYDIKSKNNSVDKNLQILTPSSFPNVKGSNLIIAGHSGTGSLAFFDDLKKLKIGSESYIYYENVKYIYKVVDIYEIEKTGEAEIIKDYNATSLVFITCKVNTNKQIVIISNLIKETNY